MWNRLRNANRATLAGAGIVLAVVLFFAVNLVSSLTFGTERLDLTQDKLFTVTPSTERVLKEIPEPITLNVYESAELTDSVPALRVYADRVNELLRTYKDIAGDNLIINRVNPVPFSAEEDRALSYGLQGINLNRTGERGYFGLVGTNGVDQLETVKFFSPAREPFLEYDLTRIIARLSSPSEPKIGVIDGLGMFGDAQRGRYPSAMIETLNADFELQSLEQNIKGIADDIDGLVIVHPYKLSPQTKYAVDQFALSGKPVMVFIDPLAENSQPGFSNPNEPQFPSSDIKPLSDAWGFEMVPGKVVGDRNMALRITGVAGGRRVVADYLPWLQVRSDALNSEDVVTSQLQLMRISSAGSLHPIDGATTTFTPLISTTRDSELFDEKDIRARPNPMDLMSRFQSSGQVQVLAARITGPVKTAFPDGPPAAEEDPADQQQQQQPNQPDATTKPQLKESQGPIHVIVVADSDMLANSHVANDNGQPISNNGDFVTNALQNLTGGSELIGLRGRGLSFRPFTRIEAMEAQSAAKYQAKEQELSNKLEEIQQRLAQLQQPGPGNDAAGGVGAVTEEQQRAIADANREMLQTRQELRDVRASLRADIDALDTRLRLINILLIPGLVVLLGILVAFWRRERLARYLRRRRSSHARA